MAGVGSRPPTPYVASSPGDQNVTSSGNRVFAAVTACGISFVPFRIPGSGCGALVKAGCQSQRSSA